MGNESRWHRSTSAFRRACNHAADELISFFERLEYYTLYKENGDQTPSREALEPKGLLELIEQEEEIVREFLALEQKFSGFRLAYRSEQDDYAMAVMDTIQDGHILLIQGGVGSGKTYGYMLPIGFIMKKDTKFSKVLIVAPTKALQEQLMRDIPVIEEICGIKIKAVLAKGINNYACLDRIYRQLQKPLSKEESQLLQQLKSEILQKSTSDKAHLRKVSEEVWDKVRLKNRGYCSDCKYSSRCPYYKLTEEELANSRIIITNHGNFIRSALDGSPLVQDADMVVIDEVHNFPDNVLSIREKEISLDNIAILLNDISDLMPYSTRGLSLVLKHLFYRVRESAKNKGKSENRGNYPIDASSKIEFDITPSVLKWLDIVNGEMQNLIRAMEVANKDFLRKYNMSKSPDSIMGYSKKMDRLKKYLGQIREIHEAFVDMKAGIKTTKKKKTPDDDSKNIYWASFHDPNKITIRYTPKDNLDLMNKIFSGISCVLTSATMGPFCPLTDDDRTPQPLVDGNRGSFSPVVNGLSLKDLDRSSELRVYDVSSPYVYDEQALIFFDPNMPKPVDYSMPNLDDSNMPNLDDSNMPNLDDSNMSEDKYIEILAAKIDEAIKLTNGKALILFTSKKMMYRVYKYISLNYEYDFSLLLQGNGNDEDVKEKFSNDINSCLFATGTFWEGIDIRGPALSNLIITHLPFEQVDAINKYKSSLYNTKEEMMREVYVPKMLLKFHQGFGRLIRSHDDRGVVICLDPRFSRYQKEICETIGIGEGKVVTNLDDLRFFYRLVIEPRALGMPQETIAAFEDEYNSIITAMAIVSEGGERKPHGR